MDETAFNSRHDFFQKSYLSADIGYHSKYVHSEDCMMIDDEPLDLSLPQYAASTSSTSGNTDDNPLDLRMKPADSSQILEENDETFLQGLGLQPINFTTKRIEDLPSAAPDVAGALPTEEGYDVVESHDSYNEKLSPSSVEEQPRLPSSKTETITVLLISKVIANADKTNIYKKKVEDEAKPHRCYICGKNYKQTRDYRAHIAAHKDASVFRCDICSCELTTSLEYLQHFKTHRQKDLIPCPQCDRYFRDSYTLSTHMRTHTGEKPYKCDICGKKFRQSGTCRRHRKAHDMNNMSY